jgi:hypothetical protein
MSKPNVLWRANSEPQRAFLRSTARHCLIGGGNNSGKTSVLLAASAISSGNAKSRAIIFRKDYPSLKQIISDSHALFLPMRATYNRSDHTWRWPSGATLEFSHLEDESAVFQHSGKRYNFLGFDEVTHLGADVVDGLGNPINSAFAFMQTRLRADVNSGLALECRATGTPSGPGMVWVKNFYGIPDSGESAEFVHPLTKYRHQYIRALATDNPAISAEDYARQLAHLSAAQRRALQHGDWTAFEGQVFEEFRHERHTCRPIDPSEIPEDWDMWRSCDDGYSAPCSVLFYAYDKVADRVYVVDEVYERGLNPEELAAIALEKDAAFGRTLSGVIDSAAFADVGLGTTAGQGSRGAIMNTKGCAWEPTTKGAGSRVQGISLIHQRLALKPDGYGGLIICHNVRNLLRTLPAMVYSRTHPEDIDDNCEQHAVDSLRYGLSRRKFNYGKVRIEGI